MPIKLIPLHSHVANRKRKEHPLSLQTLSFLLWICLVFFILFVTFRLFMVKDETQGKTIALQKIRKQMNTGDLLFVSYDNTLGYSMRIVSGSIWTHVGMVMRDKKDLYIMETADYSSSEQIRNKQIKLPKTNGLLAVPLDTWLKLNQNHSIAYRQLSTPESFDRRKLIQSFWNIKQQNLDSFGVGINVVKKALFRTQSKNPTQENILCYELIEKIYQDCDIIKLTKNYTTADLVKETTALKKDFSLAKSIKLLL